MPPTNNGIDLDSVHDAYQQVYNSLTSAYWAASTIQNKDQIHGIMDVVFDLLTELNRESLDANSPEFQTLAKDLKGANDQLNTLKGQIDQLVAAVKVATQVASAIDEAITLAAKYFGL